MFGLLNSSQLANRESKMMSTVTRHADNRRSLSRSWSIERSFASGAFPAEPSTIMECSSRVPRILLTERILLLDAFNFM